MNPRLYAVAGLCLLAVAGPLAQPLPVDHWEVGIFTAANATAAAVTGSPLSLTVYPAALVHCLLPKAFSADVVYSSIVDGPADNIPNPVVIAFNDPTDSSKECRADVATPINALPLGVGYRGAVRAVAANGTKSDWSTPSNTFRRAPRGLPCTMPSGALGVQTNVTPDINGVQKQVSICVQQ